MPLFRGLVGFSKYNRGQLIKEDIVSTLSPPKSAALRLAYSSAIMLLASSVMTGRIHLAMWMYFFMKFTLNQTRPKLRFLFFILSFMAFKPWIRTIISKYRISSCVCTIYILLWLYNITRDNHCTMRNLESNFPGLKFGNFS